MKKNKILAIRKKYEALENKTEFLIYLAQAENLNFFSIRNHHFGKDWNIPEKYHDPYLKHINKFLKKQKTDVSS